jgi:hypothetical protein
MTLPAVEFAATLPLHDKFYKDVLLHSGIVEAVVAAQQSKQLFHCFFSSASFETFEFRVCLSCRMLDLQSHSENRVVVWSC